MGRLEVDGAAVPVDNIPLVFVFLDFCFINFNIQVNREILGE